MEIWGGPKPEVLTRGWVGGWVDGLDGLDVNGGWTGGLLGTKNTRASHLLVCPWSMFRHDPQKVDLLLPGVLS